MADFPFRDAGWRYAPPGSRVRIAVALTEDARGRIKEVAAACRALGFQHDSTLRSVGVLTGTAAVEQLAKLRSAPGVLAVETECAPRRRARA